MYLGNPLLPLTLPVNEALVKVEAVLKEKSLIDFEIGTMKLVLIPYFFFNYHYYTQKEENNQLVIDKTVDGKLILNANKLKIEKDLLKLFEKNVKKITNDAPKLEFVGLVNVIIMVSFASSNKSSVTAMSNVMDKVVAAIVAVPEAKV